MSAAFKEFVGDQRRDLPLLATKENVSGKKYIVTGGNTGLGFETAKHLVQLGASKVIIAARNIQAGESARAEIEATTGTRSVAEVWQLDLADYGSVKSFARRAKDGLDRIDALIENAGVALPYWTTSEGHETTITVNVISTLLLAVLLFPKMSAAAKEFKIVPHIVIVTSDSAFMAKDEADKISVDPLAKLDDPEQANMMQRYPLSKLLEIVAVRYLATLIPVSRTGVVVNLVNPGLCKTSVTRNLGIGLRMSVRLMGTLVGRTAEMGSRCLVHAATAEATSHGCYLSCCESRERQVPSWVTDEDGLQLQNRVWNDLAKVLESVELGCISNII